MNYSQLITGLIKCIKPAYFDVKLGYWKKIVLLFLKENMQFAHDCTISLLYIRLNMTLVILSLLSQTGITRTRMIIVKRLCLNPFSQT